MSLITDLYRRYSGKFLERRRLLFRRSFEIGPDTKILDVGCGNGSAIKYLLEGSGVTPANVHLADISETVFDAVKSHGYIPVLVPESGRLPFEDGFFDIVCSSSVIEHVTVSKDEVWTLRSGAKFREISDRNQRMFASEINRVGKRLWVQTPNKWFPVESHTWLPLIHFLPRALFVDAVKLANKVWVKKSEPDFQLLSAGEFSAMFPGTQLYRERSMLLTKSFIAIR